MYEDEGIVDRAAQLGALLESEVQGLSDLPYVADVRCLGAIAAVEFKGDDANAKAQEVKSRLLTQHILTRPLGNVIYLMPPLVTSETVLKQLTAALCAAVEEQA